MGRDKYSSIQRWGQEQQINHNILQEELQMYFFLQVVGARSSNSQWIVRVCKMLINPMWKRKMVIIYIILQKENGKKLLNYKILGIFLL